ncbi:multidrug effflux MFS transporter [Sciscionella marina]|uniref:multidrug effflux MFS transporter n=1 Tax=Sciscionella marina TaxID=508770 RepID=UPI0007C59D37|nr:multidrug effflux MFS transporter [Sciscionella marina]
MDASRPVSTGGWRARGGRLRLAALLGALSAAPSLAIDMYIPALPNLAADLRASPGQAQLSLTGFLVGLALGQLVAGPVSDMLGRRKPILVGISAFAVGCALCAAAINAPMLVIVRVVAGLVASAGLVIARAVVTDRYQGPDADRFFAALLAIAGLAPSLAPLAGGVLLQVIDWRGVFAVITVLAVAIGVGSFVWLPESLPRERRRTSSEQGTRASTRSLLTNRDFVRFAAAVGLSFASLFAVISGAPFFLEQTYGLTALQTSIVLAINGLGIVLAGQVSTRLVTRTGPWKLVLAGFAVSGSGGIILLTVHVMHAGLWAALIGLFLAMSPVGLVLPNATSLAMATRPARERAGTASAVIGVAQFAFGGIAAPLASAGGATALPIATMALVSVVAGIGLTTSRIAAQHDGRLNDDAGNQA